MSKDFLQYPLTRNCGEKNIEKVVMLRTRSGTFPNFCVQIVLESNNGQRCLKTE